MHSLRNHANEDKRTVDPPGLLVCQRHVQKAQIRPGRGPGIEHIKVRPMCVSMESCPADYLRLAVA